ncbi:hypothetical protein D3C78_1870450 [compost metagenome]
MEIPLQKLLRFARQAEAHLIVLHIYLVFQSRRSDGPVDLGGIEQHQAIGVGQPGLEHITLQLRCLNVG